MLLVGVGGIVGLCASTPGSAVWLGTRGGRLERQYAHVKAPESSSTLTEPFGREAIA
jgi:hypothetical protein